MSEFTATHVLEFPGGYTRSTGPVMGRFLGGLKVQRILGSTISDGRVVVPPVEYDPVNNATIQESALVDVGTSGTVVSWGWQPDPRDGQPSDAPFAFALIKLDGADTPMLHGVRASSAAEMSSGMRVTAVWKDEPIGTMHDLSHFVPAAEGA